MAGKRANGEGSIHYNEKRDEYIGQIRDGKKPDGSPNRIYFYSGKGGKKSDVASQMRQWSIAKKQRYADKHDVTLDEGIKAWLNIIKKPSLKPSSYDRLESIIDNQILPRIGQYAIRGLSDGIIRDELLTAMEKDDLSVSSLKKAYNAIRAYLDYAVFKGIIQFNPMGMMKPPKADDSENARSASNETDGQEDTGDEIRPLTAEETRSLIDMATSKWKTGRYRYPMGNAFIFILNTGLRMGEALALKWDDVDTKSNTVSITKNLVLVKNRNEGDKEKYKLIVQYTPKSKKSRRIVPLNRAALQVLDDLRERPGYSSTGYIIRTEEGRPMLPRSFQQTLDLLCKAAKLRKIGLHTLRHTYATRLFEKGVDIKIISELLGHSSTEITYRIYIHIIESMKRDAVAGAFDLSGE